MLVGGELRDWTDRPADARRRDAATTLVRHLVETSEPGSVLLVGPRALDLVDVVARAGTSITAIARSLDDVRSVATQHPDVRLVAGAVDRLPHLDRFDLVVALGGPAALQGPDSTGWSVRDLVADLTTRLTPAGQLVFDVPNGLGSGRLTEIPEPAGCCNASFSLGMPGTDRRGLWWAELSTVLEGTGLAAQETYAAWPVLSSPSVVVSLRALATTRGSGVAAWAATRAAQATATSPRLLDLAALAHDAFAAGQAMTLAPGWVVVASSPDTRAGLPHVIVDETWTPRELARTIVGDPAGELIVWAPEPTALGWRRTRALPHPGTTLDAAVREALRVGDRDLVRRLLHVYAAWLADDAGDAGARATALPSNVAVVVPEVAESLDRFGPAPDASAGAAPPPVGWHRPEVHLELIDSSWVPDGPASAVSLRLGLLALAADVVTSAEAHPFGPGCSTAEITRELEVLAGAGTPNEPPAVSGGPGTAPAPGSSQGANGPSQALDRDVTGLLALLAPTGLVRDHVTADGSAEHGHLDGPATTAAYRELATAHSATRQALAVERARAAWLEGTLRARDREIGVLERSIALESSAAYKAFKQLARPIPALRRRARAALERARRG
jgi:hypothetical protein